MEAVVQLVDETPGGAQTAAVSLRLASVRVTVRALICNRVEQEVGEFNLAPREVFHGLVQPSEARKLLNGYRLPTPRQLDPHRQVEIALAAFESNSLFVLFDGRQLESLDEEIALTERSVVSFVKLVPLVGG